VKLICN